MLSDQWTGLELRHLHSLRAIARTGSFHAAADSLDYTQSAVSQHLASLEAIVGVRLVDRRRGRRRVALTEAGELLLRHADAMVARLDAARADLRAYASGAAGTLRVGTYQSVGARILPALMSRYSAAWPDVSVELHESNDDLSLLRLVESGDLDLTFSVLPLPDGPFAHAEVLRDPYVLLAAVGSPLATCKAAPSLATVLEGPLIGFGACRSNQLIEASIRAHGLEPRVVFRSDDNGTIQGLVASGYGAAMLPALAVDTDDPRVTTRPLDVPARQIAIAWHRDRHRSPAAESFVATVTEVCAGIGQDGIG